MQLIHPGDANYPSDTRNKRAVHFFACLSKENVIFAIEIIQLPQAQVS